MKSIILGILLLTSALFAVDLESNKHYVGPLKLTATELGVSMGLPKGWGAIARNGEGLLLTKAETTDAIVIRAKDLDLNAAGRYLNRNHYLKKSVKIFPVDRIVKINNHIFQRRFVFNESYSKQSILLSIVLGPQNRAVILRATYDVKNETTMKAINMNIVQTLSFTPTKRLSTSLNNLQKRLQGSHVVYLKRDGAYDDKRELWLCSNGRFQIYEERTIAGGMSRTREEQFGVWLVENDQLILQGDNGQERLIILKRQNNALLFDGHRSYQLENHRCK